MILNSCIILLGLNYLNGPLHPVALFAPELNQFIVFNKPLTIFFILLFPFALHRADGTTLPEADPIKQTVESCLIPQLCVNPLGSV